MTVSGNRDLEHFRFMLECVELALTYVEGYSLPDFMEDKRT